MVLSEKDSWINDMKVYIDLLVKTNVNYFKLIGLDCIDNSYKMQNKFLELTRDITIFFPSRTKNSKDDLKEICGESIWGLEDRLLILKGKYQELFTKHKVSLFKIKLIRNKLEHNPHKINGVSLGSGSGYSNIEFCYTEIYTSLKIMEDNQIKQINFSNQNIEKTTDNEGYIRNIKFLNMKEEIYSIRVDYTRNKNAVERIKYEEVYKINTRMLKNIITDLNLILIDVIKELYKFYEKLQTKDKEHPYFKRCFSFSFSNMNKVLNSEDAYLVSKALAEAEDFF